MGVTTSDSPIIRKLKKLFKWNGDDGPLQDLREAAEVLKKEVEAITKEVGGDVWKSQRYKECQAIIEHIRYLENLSYGSYTFQLPTMQRPDKG